MASTPIIRYYDHLRFVYEVESTMRQLRRNSEGDDSTQPKPRESAPGESRQNPGKKDGGSHVEPPQQSGSPTFYDSESLESSLTFPALAAPLNRQARPAHSGGSVLEVRERSTKWTA
jgi:hypothetical protein